MQLILSGGGDAPDSRLLDELFLNKIPQGRKKILYIPIAWKSGVYDDCYKWFTSTFGALGFSKIEMWESLDNKKYQDLDSFGAIYIGGGNTYLLLSKIRRSGFDGILREFIDSGRIVYGGSAGAIILGKDIRTSSLGKDSDKNLMGITNFSGMNLLKGYAIQCHYQKDQDEELKGFSSSYKLPIIALPERAGLYVEDNKARVVGYEPAYVFQVGGKVVKNYSPGELCY